MKPFNWDDFPEADQNKEFNWDQFEAVSPKQSFASDLTETAQDFGNATIEDLPGIGAMAGGVIGGVSPLPGGALIGAGVGGYTGTAAKNFINTYRNSEEAPQESSDYITEPLESGANAVSGQVLGDAFAKHVGEPAYELGKKGLSKGEI